MNQLDNEKTVIGAVFLENKSYWKVADIVTPDHFTTDLYCVYWSRIQDMMECKKPIDVRTFFDKPSKDDMEHFIELMEFSPTAANIRFYAMQLDESLVNRRIDQLASDLHKTKGTPEERLDYLQGQIMHVSPRGAKDVLTIGDIQGEAAKKLEERYRNRGKLIGIPTSIPELDKATLGFCPTDLIIIAARPSMGKTALSLQVASNAGRGLFFSLEMGNEQLYNRQWSNDSGVNLGQLRSGHLDDTDFSRLMESAGRMKNCEMLYCDIPGIDIFQLKSIARREHLKNPLQFLIVDYLQLITTKRQLSRNQEVGLFSRELKSLAKELNIPVVALSQLNRGLESREDKRPRMSDLRESGEIEQDADLILFPYRPSVYCDDCKEKKKDCGRHEKHKSRNIDFYQYCEIICAKHRNGELFNVKTYFDGARQRFTEIENRHFPEPGRTTRIYQ